MIYLYFVFFVGSLFVGSLEVCIQYKGYMKVIVKGQIPLIFRLIFIRGFKQHLPVICLSCSMYVYSQALYMDLALLIFRSGMLH